MNWEAMSAIGEMVGALGVIFSVLYLALQVRQNSKVTRSATRQAISNSQVDMGFRFAESHEMTAAFGRMTDTEFHTAELEAQLRDYLCYRALFRAFENQYQDGTFDADMWIGCRENMRRGFSTSSALRAWESCQGILSPDFTKFIDSELIGSTDAAQSGPGDPAKA